MITARILQQIMPTLRADKAAAIQPHLFVAAERFNIIGTLRESAFLAQLAHESGALAYWEEIASGAAYEGRVDLGNTHPGDGRKFKGRGPIQLTGRANYRKAGAVLGLNLESNPEQAATHGIGSLIAAWYWSDKKLNELADEGTEDAFRRITRRINGGYNGWQDRLAYYKRARLAYGLAPL